MDQIHSDDILYQSEHIHDSKGPGVLASLIICSAFACTAVLLRCISRRMCTAGIGLDDYMILVALVNTNAACLCPFPCSKARSLNGRNVLDRLWVLAV